MASSSLRNGSENAESFAKNKDETPKLNSIRRIFNNSENFFAANDAREPIPKPTN